MTLSEAMEKINNLAWPVGIKPVVAPDASEMILFTDQINNSCKTAEDLRYLRKCTDVAMTNLRKVNPKCLLMIIQP